MELAIGRFPFDASDAAAGDRASAGPMGILDLLQQIVHEPAPRLPECDAFPPILDEMIQKCLLKNPDDRPTPRQLYVRHILLLLPTILLLIKVSIGKRHVPCRSQTNTSGFTGMGSADDGASQP